jgi:hypothetical protein
MLKMKQADADLPGWASGPQAAMPHPRYAVTLAVLAALLGAAGLAFVLRPAPGALAGQAAPQLLPDLVQQLPSQLSVRRVRIDGRRRYHLGFGSAVDNIGAGPLIVEASRDSLRQREMVAQQVVNRRGALPRRVRRVGRLRFVNAETHYHWHLLDFDRYELRTPDTNVRVVRDRKSGFCLGDRVRSRLLPPGRRRARRLFSFSNCGDSAPGLLAVREGISPGWGDDYDPIREGQYLDVTDVADGRYVLVHRANPTGRLRERTRSNNASSLLVELARPAGPGTAPRVRVLAGCPGADRCAER